MDRLGFIGILKEKLQEIDLVLQRLSQSGQVHQIETDLILSKIRDLYEDVHQFAAIHISKELPEIQDAAVESVPAVDITETGSMVPQPPPGFPEPETVSVMPDKIESIPEGISELPNAGPPVEEILITGSEFEPEPLLDFLAPSTVPGTQNPEPSTDPDANRDNIPATPYLEPDTPNPEPATRYLKSNTPNLEPETSNPEPATGNREPFDLRPALHESKPVFQEPSYLKARQVPEQKPVQPDLPLFQREGSLNEAFAKQKPKQDIASAINETPISDIWSAIAINDRFLFTRELFGNNPELFKSTVSLLNGLPSWEGAKDYISARFSWNTEDQVARDFLILVRRRFLK